MCLAVAGRVRGAASINANPKQTFALRCYSQGAEAASRVLALITDPIVGGVALAEAIKIAFACYSTNPPTLPHVTYDVVPALPGQNSVAVAIGHLNNIAAAISARTAV